MLNNSIYIDIGRFSIDLSAGNRTSTLIEQFLLPAQRPQIIQIQADSSSSDSLVKPTDDVKSLVGTHEIPLEILLMLVGSRGKNRTSLRALMHR